MASLDPSTLEVIERLRERRGVLGKRLRQVQGDRRRESAPLSADFAEQAVERENDDVLDALDERERDELALIDRALARVDAGCFGICDACGSDIDPRRLETLPETSHCIHCAEATE
jgi:RNA polymerase-binding transcription factor DksA